MQQLKVTCICVRTCTYLLVWSVHSLLNPCHIALYRFQFPQYTLARNQMDLHEYKMHFAVFPSLILPHTQRHKHTRTSLIP